MELYLQGEAGKDGPPGISGSPGEQVKGFYGASATLDFQRIFFSFFFLSCHFIVTFRDHQDQAARKETEEKLGVL